MKVLRVLLKAGPVKAIALPQARTYGRLYWAAAAAILLLTACGDKPPVVSADTSCERFAHISFSDAQIKAVAADWTLWESVADQVVAFNIQYDAHCMEVLREGK